MAARRRGLKHPVAIDRPARDLLLDLLELPDPILSPAGFAGFFRTEGQALIDAGLLVAEGHEAVAVSDDHDDAPVRLVWSPEHGQHGFFSPTRGWTLVDSSAITRYRVHVEALIAGLLQKVGVKATAIHPLASKTIWDVGDVRLPHRTHRTAVWFVRRADNPDVWRDLREHLIAIPASRLRLVLSSTRRERLPADVPQGNTLVSVRDVVPTGGALALDGDALASALTGNPWGPSTPEPLVVLGDGREVHFLGEVFHFPKGDQKQRIIRFLEGQYRLGKMRVPVAQVIAALDLPARTRIRDYFKGPNGRRVMTDLLFEAAGECGFRFPAVVPT